MHSNHSITWKKLLPLSMIILVFNLIAYICDLTCYCQYMWFNLLVAGEITDIGNEISSVKFKKYIWSPWFVLNYFSFAGIRYWVMTKCTWVTYISNRGGPRILKGVWCEFGWLRAFVSFYVYNNVLFIFHLTNVFEALSKNILSVNYWF